MYYLEGAKWFNSPSGKNLYFWLVDSYWSDGKVEEKTQITLKTMKTTILK